MKVVLFGATGMIGRGALRACLLDPDVTAVVDVYVLRPFLIQPLHGITSRTWWYRAFHAGFAPFAPIWKALLPGYVTATEQVGKAMLILARRGAPKRLLETGDINRLVREHSIA